MDVDLAQLQTLVAVIDEGTLEAAARRLHVTPSAVSQRLRALEVATGRVLVQRGRPATVTSAGEPVLRLARQVGLLVADTSRHLDPAEPGRPPVVPIAVNADSLATWALPALAPLADELRFDLHSSDQTHTSTLLRAGTVMGAVTSDAEPVAGCRVTPLGRMRYLPCAAPGFADRWFPRGPAAEALRSAPVVVFDRRDDLQHVYLRRHLPTADVPIHYVPSSADYLRAVALGFGWGMLPELQLDPGRRPRMPGVGAVTPFDPAGAVDVLLYWQQWRLDSDPLDRVADALVRAAHAQLRGRA
ncbi:LysR family transcriptional regulator ArgP [Geodermatophilus sp. YIM 151500]|uniref:LysR family transcriptional regulator ArgP n=1 Tax=Geodermatophilus sp. YIM 151500 TaxID=2984531 RepID=UPI0021E4DC65|nr:LysR family transcriptional regulator ArgP [Geodermatophilus sp. YIM 151500]MCV2490320.1 LysR family transcriptional regulator ArgP [Geodermatophilus sp. YIM 151500]